MHLWYICVLLQFFAIFVVIFYLWNKFNISRQWRIITLVCLGGISWSICFQGILARFGLIELSKVYVVYSWTTARIWELIVGGLISQFISIKLWRFGNKIALMILALFIAFAFVPLSQSSIIIGVSAVFSIVLILFGGNGFLSELLCTKVLQLLGKIYFSLYLVHWPIIWIVEYLYGGAITIPSLLLSIAFISLLTLLVYQRFEKKRCGTRDGITILCVSLLAAFSILSTHGFKDYFHVEINSFFDSEVKYQLTSVPKESALMKNSDKISINTWGGKQAKAEKMYYIGNEQQEVNFVLMGDSHAYHFTKAFDLYGKQNGWRGIYLNTYVNPFYHNTSIDVDHTETDVLVDWLKGIDSVKYIIVAQWWAFRFNTDEGFDLEQEQNIVSVRSEQFRQFCVKMRDIGNL